MSSRTDGPGKESFFSFFSFLQHDSNYRSRLPTLFVSVFRMRTSHCTYFTSQALKRQLATKELCVCRRSGTVQYLRISRKAERSHCSILVSTDKYYSTLITRITHLRIVLITPIASTLPYTSSLPPRTACKSVRWCRRASRAIVRQNCLL